MLSRSSIFFLLGAIFVATTNAACPDVPDNGCSICGENKCIDSDKKDEIFSFPGQPAVPCSLLQTAGEMGLIPLDQCSQLPSLIDVCNCLDNGMKEAVFPPAMKGNTLDVSTAANARSLVVSAAGAVLLGLYLN